MRNNELQSQLKQICHTVLEVDSHLIAIEKVVAYDYEHSVRGIDIDVYAQLADSTKKKNWQVYAQLTSIISLISDRDELLDDLKERLAKDWRPD